MPHRLDSRAADFEARFARFLGAKRESRTDVSAVVAEILAAVRARGDAALIELTERFDRLALTAAQLRIPTAELDAAAADCDPETLAALRLAAERIEAFHARQRPSDLDYRDSLGLRLGQLWRPIGAVGLYVPGGTAAYPSSVLMNAIPAKVAGVERLAMVVPSPDGRLDPLLLAAAAVAGIDEVYRIGGAQAVAALAFGTASVAPVDKIVGPGNAYVAEAKRQVFGQVGIDTIAGPSEVLIVADADNDPAWIAIDLLAQAEHDRAAQSILITDDEALAEAVERAVLIHLQSLPRSEIAAASWQEHGAVILVEGLAEAPALIDRVAPEHLELAVAEPEALMAAVRNAGAIFLGKHAPEALGDYLAGPNHVLPTDRSARFSSGLSVLDFMKRSSVVACDPAGLAALGPAGIALARAEGLEAHARSLEIRLADDGGPGPERP